MPPFAPKTINASDLLRGLPFLLCSYQKQRCYTQPSLMSFVLFAFVCFRAGHIAIYLPTIFSLAPYGRYVL